MAPLKRSAVRFGHPAGEILAAAQEQDADLIVVGARGGTRAGPFRMGDVAQKVVKYASGSLPYLAPVRTATTGSTRLY